MGLHTKPDFLSQSIRSICRMLLSAATDLEPFCDQYENRVIAHRLGKAANLIYEAIKVLNGIDDELSSGSETQRYSYSKPREDAPDGARTSLGSKGFEEAPDWLKK